MKTILGSIVVHNPQFSVLIPVYNSHRFIKECVESVLSQTFSNFELVIVDNCSNDGTYEYLAQLEDNRICLYRNESNIGMTPNWNKALQYAQGNYIKMVMADDVLEPTCLENFNALFSTNPSVVLISCGRKLINDNGDFIGIAKPMEKSLLLEHRNAMRHIFIHSGYLIGLPTSCAFHRTAALNVGNFIEYLEESPIPTSGWAYDWEYWVRLLSQGDLYYTSDMLVKVRLHNDSGTASVNKNFENRFIHTRLLLRKIWSEQNKYITVWDFFNALYMRYVTILYDVSKSHKNATSIKTQFIKKHFLLSFFYYLLKLLSKFKRKSHIIAISLWALGL